MDILRSSARLRLALRGKASEENNEKVLSESPWLSAHQAAKPLGIPLAPSSIARSSRAGARISPFTLNTPL
jgi:hypothetical protein